MIALFAMLGVSAASTTPAHMHLTSSASRCDLCFVAHVGAVSAPGVQAALQLEVSGRAIAEPVRVGYTSRALQALSSRGPPSASL